MKDARRRQVHHAKLEQENWRDTTALTFRVRDLPKVVVPRTHNTKEIVSSDGEDFFHAMFAVGKGDYLAVTGSRLKLYDAHTLKYAKEFDPELFVNLNNTATLSDSVIAVVCSDQYAYNYLYTWNIVSGTVIDRLKLGMRTHSLSGVVALENNTLVCGDFREVLYVVMYEEDNNNGDEGDKANGRTGRNLRLQGVLKGEYNGYSKIVAHHNTFVVTNSDNSVSIWDTTHQCRIAAIPTTDKQGIDINERYFVSTADATLRIYEKYSLLDATDADATDVNEVSNNKSMCRCAYSYKLTSCVTDERSTSNTNSVLNGVLKLLPNNLLAIGASGDGILTIFNLETKRIVARYRIPYDKIVSIDVTASAKLVVSAGMRQRGKHAVVAVDRPREVVRALQQYAERTYGSEFGAEKKNLSGALANGVAHVVKTVLVCAVLKDAAQLICSQL